MPRSLEAARHSGQWGEISVMMSYLFQGWNCRGPAKYRDMILDIGTEEIGHVEMLATMIARLLESSPIEMREEAAKNSAACCIVRPQLVSAGLAALRHRSNSSIICCPRAFLRRSESSRVSIHFRTSSLLSAGRARRRAPELGHGPLVELRAAHRGEVDHHRRGPASGSVRPLGSLASIVHAG